MIPMYFFIIAKLKKPNEQVKRKGGKT